MNLHMNSGRNMKPGGFMFRPEFMWALRFRVLTRALKRTEAHPDSDHVEYEISHPCRARVAHGSES